MALGHPPRKRRTPARGASPPMIEPVAGGSRSNDDGNNGLLNPAEDVIFSTSASVRIDDMNNTATPAPETILPLKRRLDSVEVAVTGMSSAILNVQKTLTKIEERMVSDVDRLCTSSGGQAKIQTTENDYKESKAIQRTLQALRVYKPDALSPLVGKAFLALCSRGAPPTVLLVALACPCKEKLGNIPPEEGPHGKKAKPFQTCSPPGIVFDAIVRHAAYGVTRRAPEQLKQAGVTNDPCIASITDGSTEWKPTKALGSVAKAAISLIRQAMRLTRLSCRAILRERLGAGLAATNAGGSDNITVEFLFPDHSAPPMLLTMKSAEDAKLKDHKRYQFKTTTSYSIVDEPETSNGTIERAHSIVEIADEILALYAPPRKSSDQKYFPGVGAYGFRRETDAMRALHLFSEAILDAVRKLQGIESDGDFLYLEPYAAEKLLGVSMEAKMQTTRFVESVTRLSAAQAAELDPQRENAEDFDEGLLDDNLDADFASSGEESD